MPMRTFLAVDLDEPTRASLAELAGKVSPTLGKMKFVAPENLHVTMKFLGDVPDEVVRDVCEAAERAATRLSPFDVSVSGLSFVPPKGRRLRMIWANVRDESGGLRRLFDELELELGELGYPPEPREFAPHVTLARVKVARDAGAVRAALSDVEQRDFGLVSVGNLTVYRSELTRRGPVYTPMARPGFGTGGGG
ncbi:MAG: RNA 2',3'-cyclic phosphodiesterase [Phycisphaerae bacterium]